MDDNPEHWFTEHGDTLFSFARARVRDHAIAEDLVQETMLAAVRSQSQFDNRSTRLTWLIGILRRKIVDHYRGVGRQARRQAEAETRFAEDQSFFNERGEFKRTIESWPDDPSMAMENAEFWQIFHKCRSALPDNLLAAFTLREVDQFDTATVCKELGITATNLAVRIHRARLLMRQCLERKYYRQIG